MVEILIDILHLEFQKRKTRNRHYSMRAFSAFLDIDPSNLSKILNRKIRPKEKLCLKLAKKIGVDFQEVSLLNYKYRNGVVLREYEEESFSVISEWYYYALMELIKVPGIKHQSKGFSQALNIDEILIDQALSTLVNLGFLKFENGFYFNADLISTSLGANITSVAHRNQQKQFLEKSIFALENVPIEFRSQSTVTMAINRNKLEEAKELIKFFRRKMASFLTDDESHQTVNDVYNLSISLYPLTSIYQDKL